MRIPPYDPGDTIVVRYVIDGITTMRECTVVEVEPDDTISGYPWALTVTNAFADREGAPEHIKQGCWESGGSNTFEPSKRTIEAHRLQDAIDESFKAAAAHMEMADVDLEDDEAREAAFEARHHCGTCEVRNIMEIVMPPIEAYIKFLKNLDGGE